MTVCYFYAVEIFFVYPKGQGGKELGSFLLFIPLCLVTIDQFFIYFFFVWVEGERGRRLKG